MQELCAAVKELVCRSPNSRGMRFRGCLVTALLLLMLGLTGSAQDSSWEVELTVHSFPPSQVYLDSALEPSFLGASGAQLRVKPPVLLDPQGQPTQFARGVLILRAPGHAETRVEVTAQDWKSGRLPASGSYRLPADSLLVGAQDYLQAYPFPLGLGFVLLVVGAVQARRWRRLASSRAGQVKELASQLDTRGDPLIGKKLGRYTVEARLGQGGMASVYRVTDETGDYAAKVIYYQDLCDISVDRFRREFRLLSQLKHPTFPRCFDYQEEEGMAFCVMELVKGQTLRQFIRPDGLRWDQIWPWVRAVLEGLQCAHERGIVHRDLKPENIMVNDEQVKLLDFGLARQSQLTAITRTGQALGTPQYMAPEQVYATGTEVDERTDLYSLGVIIYELLSGEPPFVGETVQDLIKQHLQSEIPPLEVEGLPKGLAEIVEVLLAKNPANRYPSAERVLELMTRSAPGAGSDVPEALDEEVEDLETIVVRRPVEE